MITDPPETNEKCEFAEFFKKLGYEYSWDFYSSTREYWHELWKDNMCVLQVDMSIPLKKILEDMCREDEFDAGYFIAAQDREMYLTLCQKVRELLKTRPLAQK